MAARKVPPEVQKVFDKYTVNFVRRLNKDKALEMFKCEFGLAPERAEIMFKMFDKVGNQVLSAWEFYLFFTSFGYDSNAYLDMYDKLQVDSSGTVDISGTWDFMKELKTLSGRTLTEEELETTMKAMAGEERSIDFHKFMELISRIKLTRC